jgi:cysteinyl-tRNA synthetase
MKWQFKGEIFGTGALHTQAATGTGTSAALTSGTGVAQLSGKTPTVKESLGDASIEAKIAERAEAKKKKDFKRADAIRAELHSQGIIIEDKPDGTSRWKR